MLSPVHWATTRYQWGKIILDSLDHDEEFFMMRIKYKVTRVIAIVNGNKNEEKREKAS